MNFRSLRRITSTVLAVAMSASMIPWFEHPVEVKADWIKSAENTSLGMSTLKDPVKAYSAEDPWTGTYLYYGKYDGDPIKFRLLKNKGTSLFLDSDQALYYGVYRSYSGDTESNAWYNSGIRSGLNGDSFLTKENGFTDAERSNILTTAKSDHGLYYYGNNVVIVPQNIVSTFGSTVSIKDKVFLLDVEDLNNPEYGYAFADGTTTNRLKTCHNTVDDWWVINKVKSDKHKVAAVGNLGQVKAADSSLLKGVSPAMNISTTNILFTSLSEGNAKDNTAAYKLTLKDPKMVVRVTDDESRYTADGKVRVAYSITGTNKDRASQVSVLITDDSYLNKSANILYYGKLDGEFGTTGEGVFQVPSTVKGIWGTSYHVYVFAEQANGPFETDYAGTLTELDPPIYTVAVTFHSGKGSFVPRQIVEYGCKAVRPEDPVYSSGDEVEFGGWYTDKNYSGAFDFDTPLTESIDLYARWLTVGEPTPTPGASPTSKPAPTVKPTTVPPDFVEKTQSNTGLGTTRLVDTTTSLLLKPGYVYYGNYDGKPVRYRVILNNTDIFGSRTLFLDCDNILYSDDTYEFTRDNGQKIYGNGWTGSLIGKRLNGENFLDKGVFTDAEKGAIANSRIAEHDYDTSLVPEEIASAYKKYTKLRGEKVFLLDLEDVYRYSLDNYFGIAKTRFSNDSVDNWALRSDHITSTDKYPLCLYSDKEPFISDSTRVNISPAMNISLSNILFTTWIGNDDHKLTVTDPKISVNVTGEGVKETSSGEYRVPYSVFGAHKNEVTQVSVFITKGEYSENNWNFEYYTKLDTGGDFGIDGEGYFSIPKNTVSGTWGTDYHVYLVAEDVNGATQTDYASSIVELDPPINTLKVTFESNGGKYVKPQKVEYGCAAIEPEAPQMIDVDGLKFDAWYSDKELTDKYDFATPVTSDITLYAKWVANTAPTPTVTKTPTKAPTKAPATPTAAPTVTSSVTPTKAPSGPTLAATATSSPVPATKAPTPTKDPKATPSVSATPSVTDKPVPTVPKPTSSVTATPGPSASVSSVPSVTPTDAPEDPKAQILAFVERIYKYVLDREPEAEGAAFWSEELYAFRRTGAEVGLGFIFSEEFVNRGLSDEEFVTVLYNTFFGREPEEGGFAFWTGALKDGTLDRNAVANGFIYSQEWADTCARYGIRSGGEIKPGFEIEPTDLTYAFVERMYTTAMGRESDAEGAKFWAGELSNFRYSGEQVGVMFFLSDEMTNFDLTDEQFVTRLYKTFMDRDPEEGGFNFWVGYLKDGGSREGAVLGFTRSEEFVNKCIEARILPY